MNSEAKTDIETGIDEAENEQDEEKGKDSESVEITSRAAADKAAEDAEKEEDC